MKDMATQRPEQENFEYSVGLPEKRNVMGRKDTVKSSQFEKPLFEFSGACAGSGPAWANSLFEDNAEYGYGMKIGSDVVRETLKKKVESLMTFDIDSDLKDALNNWVENFSEGQASQDAGDKVRALLD